MDMTSILYAIMVCAVFAMIWAHLQFRKRGVPWARPLAGLCGIVALILGLTAVGVYVWSRTFAEDAAQAGLRQAEQRACAALGREVGEHFAGKRICVVTDARAGTSGERPNDRLAAVRLQAFRRGLDGACTVTVRRLPPTDELPPAGPGGPEQLEAAVSASEFDAIIAANRQCAAVVSLVGLPADWQEMAYWHDAKPDDLPQLVLAYVDLQPLRPHLEQRTIAVILHRRQEISLRPRDPSTTGPGQGYLLITPANIDIMAQRHQGLFATEQTE